jgi:phosphohistidine phosphatase SixA
MRNSEPQTGLRTKGCLVRLAVRQAAVLAAVLATLPIAPLEAQHAPVPSPPAAATTIVITRHAERADDGTTRDPALSEAGRTRATKLAAVLAPAGVDQVITTQYERTRATAQPLADRLGLELQIVEAVSGGAAAHVDAVRAAVLALPAGSVVLVVGHSNTVPPLVRALTGIEVPDMPESEYGTLYVVTLGDGATERLIRASY